MPNNRETTIGAAFSHKEGPEFSIEFKKASPIDGCLVPLPPDPSEDRK